MDSSVAQQSFFDLIKGKSIVSSSNSCPVYIDLDDQFELIIIKGTLNYDSIRMLKLNTLFNMKMPSSGNLSCTHFTDSSQSLDEGRSLAKHSLDTVMVSFLHVLYIEKKKKGEGCKAYMLEVRDKIISFLCFHTNFLNELRKFFLLEYDVIHKYSYKFTGTF